jgi:hypothetical protein
MTGHARGVAAPMGSGQAIGSASCGSSTESQIWSATAQLPAHFPPLKASTLRAAPDGLPARSQHFHHPPRALHEAG